MTAPTAERIREIRADDANGFGCGRSHDLLAALDHVAEHLRFFDEAIPDTPATQLHGELRRYIRGEAP